MEEDHKQKSPDILHVHIPLEPSSSGGFYRSDTHRPHPDMENLLQACKMKDLAKVREILASGLSIHYKERTRANRTPLLYAAKFNFVEAVEELLDGGADPSVTDDNGITPLHAAASHGNLDPIKILIKAGVDPNVKDKHGKTPLHFATQALGEDEEYNAVSIISTLLKAGATVSVKDEEGKTPLHTAAFAGSAEVISLLLAEKGASLLSEKDKDGRTPLHQVVLGARSLSAVTLILQAYPPVDAKDIHGQTALHYVAARPINYVDNEFDGDCLELLLSYGASVHCKDDDGYNPLSLALQRTMWWSRQSPRDAVLHSVQLLIAKGCPIVDGFDMWRIVETFPSLVMVALNQSVRTNTSAKDSPHLKLIFDFRPLTVTTRLLSERKRQTATPIAPADECPIPPPLLTESEISMLHYISWAGHKYILRHPLCSAFLHLKWLNVRKYFIMHVLLYCFFVLSLSLYIVDLKQFTADSSEAASDVATSEFYLNRTSSTHGESNVNQYMKRGLWFMLLFFSVYFVLKEVLQIGHSPSIYISHYENYLDVLILVCVLLLLFRVNAEYFVWHRNMSTLAIICSWSRLMLFLGQFPSCGVYIVMFTTVCRTVFGFLAMYLPLLIGFAFGFFILLEGAADQSRQGSVTSFQEIPISFVSTVIMMVGEIDYTNKILDNENLPSKAFPCIVLIAFILLIYIILSNLLVALAVSDLHSIQQRSELLRLSRQVELIGTVESFLKSPFVPAFVRKYFQKSLSVSNRHTGGVVAILPNKKPGYVERLFLKLLFVFRCRKLLTKVFEFFVVNFIPPDQESSLPISLLQEATQLALTELEIEKRDKLLFFKSHQIGSLRNRAAKKKQKQTEQVTSLFPPLPKRDSLQEHFKSISHVLEACDTDDLAFEAHKLTGESQRSMSIKASLWRAGLRKETFRILQTTQSNIEKENLKHEIKQLRYTIETLQSSLNSMTVTLQSKAPADASEEAKRSSVPSAKPNRQHGIAISPLVKHVRLKKEVEQKEQIHIDEEGENSDVHLTKI